MQLSPSDTKLVLLIRGRVALGEVSTDLALGLRGNLLYRPKVTDTIAIPGYIMSQVEYCPSYMENQFWMDYRFGSNSKRCDAGSPRNLSYRLQIRFPKPGSIRSHVRDGILFESDEKQIATTDYGFRQNFN